VSRVFSNRESAADRVFDFWFDNQVGLEHTRFMPEERTEAELHDDNEESETAFLRRTLRAFTEDARARIGACERDEIAITFETDHFSLSLETRKLRAGSWERRRESGNPWENPSDAVDDFVARIKNAVVAGEVIMTPKGARHP
jgi:hypothetical protein